MLSAHYTVHSCNREEVVTQATLPGGKTVEAKVVGLVVELIADDGQSITRRYIPDDLEADAALFMVDASIAVGFAPA